MIMIYIIYILQSTIREWLTVKSGMPTRTDNVIQLQMIRYSCSMISSGRLLSSTVISHPYILHMIAIEIVDII